MSNLKIEQKVSQQSSGWWSWEVWIDGPESEFGQVQSVQYTLHPTFNDPKRTITDRISKFKLGSTGWGEFMIYADVSMQDGSVLPLRHWLRFQQPTPSGKRLVLLTCAKEDDAFTDSLQDALDKAGYAVERIPTPACLNGAVAMVIVLSSAKSPWADAELNNVRGHGIPIIVLTVGDVEPPQCMVSLPLRDKHDVNAAYRALQDVLGRPALSVRDGKVAGTNCAFWDRRLKFAEYDLRRAAESVYPLVSASGGIVATALAVGPNTLISTASLPSESLMVRRLTGDVPASVSSNPKGASRIQVDEPLTAFLELGDPPTQDPVIALVGIGDEGAVQVAPGWLKGQSAPPVLRVDATAPSQGSAIVSLTSGKLIGIAGQPESYSSPFLREVLDLPAPPPAGLESVEDADLEKVSASDYDDRKGYDAKFLGVPVPLPKTSKKVVLLTYTNFTVGMLPERKMAMFTAVNLGGKKLADMTRAGDPWRFDPRMPVEDQLGGTFYAHTPFDRGHMVRRLDPVWGPQKDQAELDTFHYPNSCPQHKDLNRKNWSDLEDYVYDNAQKKDLKVTVMTGPVLKASDPDFHGIKLPAEFWKVVVMRREDNHKLSATGYLLSQQDMITGLEFTFGEFRTYQVSIAAIEKKTGLDFGDLRKFDPKVKSAGLEAVPSEIRGPEDLDLGAPEMETPVTLQAMPPAAPAVSRWANVAEGERALQTALSTFDWKEADSLTKEFISALVTNSIEIDTVVARRTMSRLRRKRRFSSMVRVGDALIQAGRMSPEICRQYSQGLIDQGIFYAAELTLRSILTNSATSRAEVEEAQGLLGRLFKQMYVNASAPKEPVNQEHLRNAYREYWVNYALNPNEQLWHGINVVAVLERARRDGVELPAQASGSEVARNIVAVLLDREANSKTGELEPFDLATLLEAHIALGDYAEAFKRAKQYTDDSFPADAFEYASTLRQFEEVWQLNDRGEPGASLLPMLRAALLRRDGGEVRLSSSEVKFNLEKVFGFDRSVSLQWYQLGLTRARSIARVEQNGKGYGTGWLIDSTDFFPAGPKQTLMVTNAHVIGPHTPDRYKDALFPENASAHLQIQGVKCNVGAVVFHSPVQELDCTIVEVPGLPADAVPLETDFSPITLADPPQRLYVIGHPGGRDLEFSLQDNFLLGCAELRVHYRTPTEPGSSGSPVFGPQDWKVIALHHSGSSNMTRLDGQPGYYEANEGIPLSAIRKATSSL